MYLPIWIKLLGADLGLFCGQPWLSLGFYGKATLMHHRALMAQQSGSMPSAPIKERGSVCGE